MSRLPERLPEQPGPGERLYRALLLLYPRRFRSDFGPAMIDLFHMRRWQYLSEGGSFVALRFWTFVLRDLVGTALPERFGPLAARLFGSSEGEGAPRALVTKTRGLGMESMWGDVRYSIRRLVRTPGFSALAILIVALGIGVNSAMFSVLNAALFRPLPFKDAHELVEIYQDSDGGDPATNSYPAYLDMAAHTDLFQGVLAVKTWVGARQVDGVSELILTEFATSSYMAVLGLSPSLGRWFDTSEDVVGGPVVGVVSHRTWTAEGSDPDVLGSVVYIGGAPVTIIGVGPSGYNGMSPVVTVDFFLSISSSDPTGAGAATLTRRQDHHFLVKARLAPGVTAQVAQGGMDALAARLAETYPELNRGRDITVLPSSSVRFHPLVDGLLLPAAGALMVVVGLVLFIACSNLANLLLVRGATRSREVAVRLALGASRRRLLRHLLTESVLIAVAGGAAGLALATWTIAALTSARLPLPIPVAVDLGLDWRVVLFTFLLSLATGVLFGLVPALQATRSELAQTLRDDARSGRWTRKRLGLTNLLLVSQVAVSIVLLVTAGLFIRSLDWASGADLGFEVDRIATVETDLRIAGYGQDDALSFYDALSARVAALPGVEGVAFTNALPLSLLRSSTLIIEGYESAQGTGAAEVAWCSVSLGYLATMGIPLLHGRTFTSEDRVGSPAVALVSEAMARTYWGRTDVVGERFRSQAVEDSWVEVVGVTGDVALRFVGEATSPLFYRAINQSGGLRTQMVVRTASDPASGLPVLREAVRQLDDRVAILQSRTMVEHLGESLFLVRAGAGMLAVFGVIALFMAGLGLYAVVSFAVAQRTAEVGIRMALGAGRSQVIGMVLSEVMSVVGVGAVIGLGLAWAATRGLGGLLYGVSTTDPVTFVGVVVVLGTVAFLATLVPARRAASANPVTALRYD